MTKFQTILARLCAASGETMLHVDSIAGETLTTELNADNLQALTEALGEDGIATLIEDEEVQLIMPGNPAQAESTGHIRMMQVIKALVGIEGSSTMLVTGSGKISTWQQGGKPVMARLDDTLLAEAFTKRVANTKPADIDQNAEQ